MKMTPTSFSFSVIGKPVPQGSKRWIGGNRIVDQAAARLKPWRTDLREAALNARPDSWDRSGAYCVYYDFYYRRPKSHLNRKGELKFSAPKFCISRSAGDIEKTARSVSDSLTHIAWDDDSQIIKLHCTKHYTPDEPRVNVSILNLCDE